jgi:fatty acid desaturase
MMDQEKTPTQQEKIKWNRPTLDKETLSRLRERSDAKGFVQVLSRLLLSVATGALAVYSWRNFALPWTLLIVYVHGMFYVYLGEHAGVHELSHGTVFKSRFWNTFFLRLCAFITWSNYIKYRASHTQHHMVTCYTGRDLEVVIPYKVTALDWLSYATIDVAWVKRTLLTTLRHAFGMVRGEWEERLFPESAVKARRELFGWARFVLIGHLILAGVFIYFDLWILIVLFTFGSMYATCLAWLTSHPQHLGMKPSVPDFRLSTRSVKVHPFVAFLHWNMDYHLEHHMYASVPFYNLPALNKEICN